MAPHDITEEENPIRAADEESPLLGAAQEGKYTGGEGSGSGNSTVADEEQPLVAEELSFGRLAVVMGAIWTGVFLAALDTTVITTLLAPISSTFSSFSSISWVATGYLIANSALQPLFGRLTDIYGRQAGLLFCNVSFALGTLMCGFAQNEFVMIAGRVIAGAGGGGLTAISSIVCTDLVPLRKRGVFQGCGNIAYGMGAALGGLFGGLLQDSIGWRWAFYIQVPMIVVSTSLVMAYVHIPIKKTSEAKHKRVDYAGSFTLVTSLVLFLVALNTGGNVVPWNHPLIWISLPLSAVFLVAFVVIEKKIAKEPVIPMDLLVNRTVLCACLTNWFMVMSLFAIFFYCPIYFLLIGKSSTASGARLMPFAIGISIGSLSSGITMNKTGKYYLVGTLAMLLFNAGALSICLFTLQTPDFPQFFNFFLFGTGYGATLTVTLLALISAVDHSQQAVATSASYAFRATGSTIGATVGSAVFQNVVRRRLWEALGDSEEARKVIRSVLEDFDAVGRLEGVLKTKVEEAFMGALHAVFWVAFGFGVLALLCFLGVKENVLHKRLDRK
ncbi:hypothetical protein RUND412_010687 [Rhizina undulata]